METEIVYIYNLLLFILYSTALSISLVNAFKEERKSRKTFFYVLSVYFVVFILDNSVISMTELISSFASEYNQSFQGTSFIKTTFFLVNNFCQLWLIGSISHSKIKRWEYMIVVGIFLFMLLPIQQSSSWRTYLYYLPNQLWLFYLGAKALYSYYNKRLEPKYKKYLKKIGLLALVFSFLILMEDSIIIFTVDQYSMFHTNIINRNVSENLFSISLCFLSIYYFLNDAPLFTSSHSNSKSYNQSFIYSFCQDYRLTEREQQICQLLLEQKHNQEIAEELFLSIGTVKTHIHNIYIKTDVKKRAELFSLYNNYLYAHS